MHLLGGAIDPSCYWSSLGRPCIDVQAQSHEPYEQFVDRVLQFGAQAGLLGHCLDRIQRLGFGQLYRTQPQPGCIQDERELTSILDQLEPCATDLLAKQQ